MSLVVDDYLWPHLNPKTKVARTEDYYLSDGHLETNYGTFDHGRDDKVDLLCRLRCCQGRQKTEARI